MAKEGKTGEWAIDSESWRNKSFKEMSRAELELYALEGRDWGDFVTATARAELHMRDVEQRIKFDEAVSKREVQRKVFEKALEDDRQEFQSQIVDDQIGAAQNLATTQHRIARAAAWAAAFSALAIIVLSVVSGLRFFAGA